MSPMPGVAVIGSVNVDLTATAHRRPQPGETIIGDDFTMLLGGKGANQAIAAARAGAPTFFTGCVGDDVFRPLVIDGLTEAGVDLTHLRTVPGPTGVAHIRLDDTAQNDIIVVPLANSHLNTTQVDTSLESLASRCRVLLTQLETPPELTLHIVQRARAHNVTAVLDPAPATTLPVEVWASVDVVTPNETEATVLSGIRVTDEDSATQAGQWFLDHGTHAAIVTRGEHGSTIVTATHTHHLPAVAVPAVDTTAAGDTYAGYLGAALAAGRPLLDAARWANLAAALATTRHGASPSIPTRREVEEFQLLR